MPVRIEVKVDPEAELSNAQRTYRKLAPLCSVQKRASGDPRLRPQETQIAILAHELDDTKLCIELAKKGRTAVRDAEVRNGIQRSVSEYEQLAAELRHEKAQQGELDLLNYLQQKNITEMFKTIPTEADELVMLENAYNSLRRMENRLDLATKRFCVVNTDNRRLREEIDRLLVERNGFTLQWNRMIGKLVNGKMFLSDIFEIASIAFADRDEWCRKLDALKWKGLFKLNRDISEMQVYESELNHLAKLEEFLRVKGSQRICEADEREEIKRLEETQACEQEIAKYDALLEEIFQYTGLNSVGPIIRHFQCTEIENFSCFILLCEVLQESIMIRKDLEELRQKIMDNREMNEAREEKQEKTIAELNEQLHKQRARTQLRLELNNAADTLIVTVLKGIDELVKIVKCDCTPLLELLGNHKDVTKFNVSKFLRILETEVKSLIQVVYGAVKPPAPTPRGKGLQRIQSSKLVADPYIEVLRPNRIDKLVPYQPCAYCVEDYIMNLVFETPAVLATREYVEEIFHLEDVNTNFGIYTLTIPAKRHPYRGSKTD